MADIWNVGDTVAKVDDSGNFTIGGTLAVTGAITATGGVSGNLSATGSVTARDLVLGGTAVGSPAASASGLLIGLGTSAAPATTSTADGKFVELRCKTTAATGDNRLMYLRYDIGGAAGGEAVRAFTDLTAATSTAHGAHFSLQASDTGYVSGLGAGVRAQLYVKDAAVAAGGTYYALQAEIYSAGSSSDVSAVTKCAVLNIAATGDATGMATVLNAIAFDGTAAASGFVYEPGTPDAAGNPKGSIRILVNGNVRYLYYWDADCPES